MTLVERVGSLVERRRVLHTLVLRDLKVRYANSVLGYVWSVLDPLAMSAVYWFVFSVIFSRGNIGEEPYIVFLVAGLFAWQWFTSTLTDGSKALTSSARLIRSTKLPREIWVVRVVLAKGVEFLLTLPVLVLFAAAYVVVPNWRLVFFPFAIVLQALMLTGLVLVLAPVTALVRDFERLIRIVLRVAFYLSPIIYSIHSTRAESVAKVLQFNPLTGLLELYRSGLFGHELHVTSVLFSVAFTIVILLVGSTVFRRLESAVLKEL
jgi:ABC-2 type transport system permease protein